MEGVETQPHIQLTKSQIRPVVIVVGDPGRVELFAQAADKSTEIAYNREYRTFDCEYKGQKFLITSHGVGSAGCAICFRELIYLGAKVIFRAGTAGALNTTQFKQGDIAICHSAAKEDGVSALSEPQGIPAVADWDVTQTLREAAKANGIEAQLAITLSSDLFYPPVGGKSTLATYRDCGVHVVEMEASTLYTLARQGGIKAGCIVAIDGSPFGWNSGDYDPTGKKMAEAKIKMRTIALDAAATLAAQYQ